METWMGTVGTLVTSAPLKQLPPQACGAQEDPRGSDKAQLMAMLREKEERIALLTLENQFLRNEVERLHKRIETEINRSDALIEQMQKAAEASNQRAQAIIIHLSQQLEGQAQQIKALQQPRGVGHAIRRTFKDLKSKLPPLDVGLIKQTLHSHFTPNR